MANQDLQEDEYARLREEFNQLIVPLIRKSLHDKPADVTMYCARYFRALVEERQRSISLGAGNENEDVRRDAFTETAEKCGAVSRVQESTSLPILTDVHRDRLSLRETSSWSCPSDSSALPPRRLWNASYDVVGRIGDQPNVEKEGGLDTEDGSAKGSDTQLFVGDQGSEYRGKDLGYDGRKDDPVISKPSKRSAMDRGVASPVDREVEEELSGIVITSPIDCEVEEDLSAIVNSDCSSTNITPGAAYRKKWSSNVDSYLDLTMKSEFVEDMDGEEEFALDSNSKPCFQEDDTTETPAVSWGRISPASEPQFKELASSDQSSAPFAQKEIEDSVKLISESLQDLVKVLDSMKFFCNENLQRVKTLSEALPEKPLRAPRKKRSVTTFSSSDNLFEGKEFSRGAGNKFTATTANKSCNKTTQK
ncbi:unnamed protein product, partial [Larinioides sclopetarius]